MGYYIRKLSWKKSHPQWKLQFVSYKNSDIKESQANKPKKEWDIEKKRWRALGFHSEMSVQDARVRAKQLNSQRIIRNQEKRIQENRRQEQIEQKKNEFCLPAEFVVEFEKRFLRVRDSETENGRRKRSRSHIIWRAAQKAIAAIQFEPSEWFYCTHEIYDHFHRQRYSVRYIHVILKFQGHSMEFKPARFTPGPLH